MAEHQDESLLDKVKNAFGMGDQAGADESTTRSADEMALDGGREDGWAGVPEALNEDVGERAADRTAGDEWAAQPDGTAAEPSGLGRNPGPAGSAQYEGGATPADLGGTDFGTDDEVDTTREEVASSEFGGAYGHDDTPLPTDAAWDRGEAEPPVGEASFGSGEDFEDDSKRPY